MKEKLKFQRGNSKLSKSIYTFSLPAGHSCPFAHECKASADRVTGFVTDGKHQQFRCFAVSQEALYVNTRKARWHNYDLLLACKNKTDDIVNLIESSLPKKAEKVRVHVSGDFFSQKYFNAWMQVAKNHPDVLFYAYTKSIKYWLKADVPDNFKLTSSLGGKNDELIELNKLKHAKVVFTEEVARIHGLEIDHDDSHAYDGKESFALLLHGTQKKGSVASLALSRLRKKGIKGYSKK